MIKKIQQVIKKIPFLKILYDRGFDAYFMCEALVRYYKSDKNAFIDIKNSADKKRCFIIGNGPSLQINDLDKLKNEDSFAVNRVFRIFDKTEWRPTYYCAHDTKVLGEVLNELDDVLEKCKYVFLNSKYKGKKEFKKINKPYYFYAINREFYPDSPEFSEKLERGVYEGYTVIYSCIQIAVYLGYKEIYLLGLDHNYSVVLTADGNIKERGNQPNYMKGLEGKTYFLPQLEKTELAYKKAKEICEDKGIIIKNATRGGKLEVFERTNLDALFEV